MELKEFISTTLTEIQEGVQKAIDTSSANKTKGAINPVWGTPGVKDVQKVQFDIAVTVADKTTGSGGGGIKVVGIKIEGAREKINETSNISRIQFSIPLIPPVPTIHEES
jgi:hypothetical protein